MITVLTQINPLHITLTAEHQHMLTDASTINIQNTNPDIGQWFVHQICTVYHTELVQMPHKAEQDIYRDIYMDGTETCLRHVLHKLKKLLLVKPLGLYLQVAYLCAYLPCA